MSIILSLVFLFSLSAPLTVYADEYDESEDDGYVYDAYDETNICRVYYGDKTIYGGSKAYSEITLSYGGKTYKTVAEDDGRFTFSIPVKKIGTKFNLKIVYRCADYEDDVTYIYSKIFNNKPYCNNNSYFYNQRAFKGIVKDVHKGDVVTVKIAKNIYKKKKRPFQIQIYF